MSGRRKHIEEASYQLTIQLEEGETIARVIKVSSNLVEVENANDTKCLVLLPKKFNKRFWLKVGSFVIIELDDEKQDPTNRKIKGTITRILYPDQIRELKKQDGVWYVCLYIVSEFKLIECDNLYTGQNTLIRVQRKCQQWSP